MILSPSCKRKVLSLLTATLLLAACGGDNPETLLASARDYIAKNDHKAAIIQIKNALQANPEIGEARWLLGKALLESGDPASAEVELRKALDLKQPAEQVIPVLGRALLQSQQYRKITDELAKYELTTAEARADLLTTLAVAQATQGQQDKANAALTAALQANPENERALLMQARMKAGNRDLAGAQAIVDAILARTPASHEAWKLKGDLLIADRQIKPALAAYRRAIEARPDFVIAHAAATSLLIQQGKTEDAGQQIEGLKKIAPKNPQTLYLEAQLAFQKKDSKAARELVQQTLKLVPNHPATLQLAGAIELQEKSLLQAEAYLAKALQAAPELPLARRLLIATYLRTGQAEKAMTTLQPVLANIDQDANLLALAGEVYLQNGDPKKAEEYFAKATRLDPQDASKRTSLALSHLARGEVQSAFGELESIAATDKGTAADLALISAYLTRNEYDKALKAIDNLERKQPDNPLAANLRGRTLLAKRDVAGARQSFEKALSISPTFFPAAAALAQLDVADKQPDAARKRFESILAVDPKHTRALLAMADLKASTGGTPDEIIALVGKAAQANPTDPAPRLALVGLHLRNGNAKQAVASAQEAVAAIPDNAALLEVLGRAQLAAKDNNQALITFNKLSALQPASPQPQVRLAEASLAAGDKESAQKSLQRALDIKPDLLEAQRGLIALHLDADRYREAVAIAREVQKQRPREIIGFALEGDIGAAKKQWNDAIAAYRAGLKVAAAPDLAIKLHSTLRASQQNEEADRFAAGWLKQYSKDTAFLLYLGDLAATRKEYDKAMTYYRKVLETQPNQPIALNNLAWSAGQIKHPKALEYAEKANQMAPNQPAIMDTLAMLLAERGDTARALELLREALRRQPQGTPIRLNLAKVLIQTGDRTAARKELEELAKLGDKFNNQAEVSALLKSL